LRTDFLAQRLIAVAEKASEDAKFPLYWTSRSSVVDCRDKLIRI